jgi:hypothetical protein
VSATGSAIIIDAYGDCFLSGYNAKGDGEWNHFHNQCRDEVVAIGKRCGVHIELEKGRSAFVDGERRPVDILARCGRKLAGGRSRMDTKAKPLPTPTLPQPTQNTRGSLRH